MTISSPATPDAEGGPPLESYSGPSPRPRSGFGARVRSQALASLAFLALLHGAAIGVSSPASAGDAAPDSAVADRLAARTPERPSSILRGWPRAKGIRWPGGTEVVPFENLEGIMLVEASVVGRDGRDTTGAFVVDTGAGFLALDVALAHALGVIDSLPATPDVDVTHRPLPRFALGSLSMDQVDPVLTIDAGLVRRVTDRPVMGLLGQRPMMDRAVWIDYQAGRMALVPSSRDEIEERDATAVESSRRGLAGLLSSHAQPLPFKLAGDGKVIVQARVSAPRPPRFSPWLNWIVDTGSSKTLLFSTALEDAGHPDRRWAKIHGLSAPTLVGNARADVARVPALEFRGIAGARKGAARGARRPATTRVDGSDIAILSSDLAGLLSRATGETIHGLIGYSTLKRYRVVIDYPRRVMWLDPVPGYREERPYEYSHVGIQLERREGAIEVVAVVAGSPAAASGIAPGDRLVAVDGASADTLGVLDLARRLEGPPGSSLTVVIRRGDLERRIHIKRRRLL